MCGSVVRGAAVQAVLADVYGMGYVRVETMPSSGVPVKYAESK